MRTLAVLIAVALVAALGVVGWQLAVGNRRQARLADEVTALRQEQAKMRKTLEPQRA